MREQVFWGWGEPGAGPRLPEERARRLGAALGISGDVVSRPVGLGDVRLGTSSLGDAARARLAGVVGDAHVRTDPLARVLRCRGKSYLDLLAMRAGDCLQAPDAVVAPADAAQVQAVLEACSAARVAVVPFGGGTSVVGGLEALRGEHEAVVSLDLGRLDRVLALDARSQVAVVAAGMRLPELDTALAAHGLTLGHVPQSYEWASVGGCVATRSAGQASSGVGRIDELVIGLRCATPVGELASQQVPASAAGPSLRELVAGSEGTLGAITEVALRVRPVPAVRRYEAVLLRSFDEGLEVLRTLAQEDAAPDVARLSDEAETRASAGLASMHGVAGAAAAALVRARGFDDGCALICGWEGTAAAVARRRAAAGGILRRAGVLRAGRGPGEAWRASRFAGPHVRDDLLDRGVLVETLETATTWSRLPALREAARAALVQALGEPCLVLCHVSHVYATGASLYVTVLAPQDAEDPASQWRAAKAAATQAIVAAGATLTHHHAIGRDHAPWMAAEAGALGVDVLRAVKDRCDPYGIMNPGKLLPR